MAGDTVITVVGNLTDDPELRFTPSGAAVANVPVASTPRMFDQADERVEGRRGAVPALHRLAAGRRERRRVAHPRLAGHRHRRLKQRSYETKEGEKRTVSSSTSTRSARRCAMPPPRSPRSPAVVAASAAAVAPLRPRTPGPPRRRQRRPRRPASPTVAPGAAAQPARPTTSLRSDRLPHTPGLREPREKETTHHGQAADPQAEEEGQPAQGRKITYIDYKDTALLRKFISDRGKIRARRVTGVTVQQQREIAKAVKNAREMALLPYTSTAR